MMDCADVAISRFENEDCPWANISDHDFAFEHKRVNPLHPGPGCDEAGIPRANDSRAYSAGETSSQIELMHYSLAAGTCEFVLHDGPGFRARCMIHRGACSYVRCSHAI